MTRKGVQHLLHIESGAAPVVAAWLPPRGRGQCAYWERRGGEENREKNANTRVTQRLFWPEMTYCKNGTFAT